MSSPAGSVAALKGDSPRTLDEWQDRFEVQRSSSAGSLKNDEVDTGPSAVQLPAYVELANSVVSQAGVSSQGNKT